MAPVSPLVVRSRTLSAGLAFVFLAAFVGGLTSALAAVGFGSSPAAVLVATVSLVRASTAARSAVLAPTRSTLVGHFVGSPVLVVLAASLAAVLVVTALVPAARPLLDVLPAAGSLALTSSPLALLAPLVVGSLPALRVLLALAGLLVSLLWLSSLLTATRLSSVLTLHRPILLPGLLSPLPVHGIGLPSSLSLRFLLSLSPRFPSSLLLGSPLLIRARLLVVTGRPLSIAAPSLVSLPVPFPVRLLAS